MNGKIYGAFKKEKNEAEYIDKVQVIESKAKTKRKANKSKNVFKKAEKRCRGVFKKVVYACLVIIVVLCLLPVAFVGIASIFAGGLSIVFLLQGYPVIGIFIVLLGLTVSSIALGGLLISLIAKNKKEKLEICETEEADEIDETDEVCEGDESK
ncbi:hypothetical protein SDC9_147818 [bioreactor metagenome]|uniref:Uncharacterized protein n=1 Tax=bioreactor metagenome TaxID=1076179 RepID=A0A645EH71_9ZZZZ